MVITDEPRTRKASQLLAASIAILALSLGTLSPKKTTFKTENTLAQLKSYNECQKIGLKWTKQQPKNDHSCECNSLLVRGQKQPT